MDSLLLHGIHPHCWFGTVLALMVDVIYMGPSIPCVLKLIAWIGVGRIDILAPVSIIIAALSSLVIETVVIVVVLLSAPVVIASLLLILLLGATFDADQGCILYFFIRDWIRCKLSMVASIGNVLEEHTDVITDGPMCCHSIFENDGVHLDEGGILYGHHPIVETGGFVFI